MSETIITGYKNVTNEGVTLITEEPARLKPNRMPSKETWVSWDKIGEALFENYASADSVAEMRTLRGEQP